jgi:DNA modification methylase
MGSGTTALAAKNTKRNYIGFEQSEQYCKDAKIKINYA